MLHKLSTCQQKYLVFLQGDASLQQEGQPLELGESPRAKDIPSHSSPPNTDGGCLYYGHWADGQKDINAS